MSVGARIEHQEHLGTIRYIGEVDGTKGTWLGIEWDDPSRGKHNGERGGRKYFDCRVPNSGSFIRPSGAISYGQPFLQALTAKYIDENPGPSNTTVESYTLGSSNGVISVEAPRLNKVRSKFARIERLRELSLDDERVSSAEKDSAVTRNCQNVQGLNLSRNLIPSWSIVMTIVEQLPSLKTLILDRNRFQTLGQSLQKTSSTLNELHLNETLILWDELPYISTLFPFLERLQLGYNQFGHVKPISSLAHSLSNLLELYLDGNGLSLWTEVVEAVSLLPKLARLTLSTNMIEEVPSLKPPYNPLLLRQLVLTDNYIRSWTSINALNDWCLALETLSINGNPVFQDVSEDYVRPLVIGRIPTLVSLDGTTISGYRRQDSELFYLSHIVQSTSDEEKRVQEHPQWLPLCQKYGRPTETRQNLKEKLSDRLINVTLHKFVKPVSGPSIASLPAGTTTISIRVLPSMTVRVFQLKILKAFKLPAARARDLKVWIMFPEGPGWRLVTLAEDSQSKEIDWFGIEEGSILGLFL